jgi:hypothetical protein
MTTDKRGVSALLVQRQLGMSRYETVWMMLHKLRRAMVNATREPLRGEVDDQFAESLKVHARRPLLLLQQFNVTPRGFRKRVPEALSTHTRRERQRGQLGTIIRRRKFWFRLLMVDWPSL